MIIEWLANVLTCMGWVQPSYQTLFKSSSLFVFFSFFEECEASAKGRPKLREHLRSHTQEKVVACPGCGAMYANNTKFFDHIKRQSALEGILGGWMGSSGEGVRSEPKRFFTDRNPWERCITPDALRVIPLGIIKPPVPLALTKTSVANTVSLSCIIYAE